MTAFSKLGYRTILKTVPGGSVFDPDDDDESGLLDLSHYGPLGGPQCNPAMLLDLFVPHVLVHWSMLGDRNAVSSVYFRFEDPSSGALIVPVDQSGGSYKEFTWPDGGPGFPVPVRSDLALLYQLKLTTGLSNDDGQAWHVQLWWEPKFPNVSLQQAVALFGADALRKLAG